jgi:hypothetical protein
MKDNFDYNNDLRKRLPELKQLEGFPIGDDEDILALSNPPYYTACPNPYINEFIETFGKPYNEETDTYHREPFVGDVSEGKNHPIYLAHGYPTKVPHKAIERYIEHYTDIDEIVLDGFCGTGMTGVAARFLNRYAVLSDLSPIGTFISVNYNSTKDIIKIYEESKKVLRQFNEELGWLYETEHNGDKAKINYTVWSDVFICPFCNSEVIFFNQAFDKSTKSIKKLFHCKNCNGELTKSNCKRATTRFYDTLINSDVIFAKQEPVLINYNYNNKNYYKKPDEKDIEIIKRIDNLDLNYNLPLYKLPNGHNINQPKKSHGLTHFHHFYTKRNLWSLSKIYDLIDKISEIQTKQALLFTFEQATQGMSKTARYVPTHYS